LDGIAFKVRSWARKPLDKPSFPDQTYPFMDTFNPPSPQIREVDLPAIGTRIAKFRKDRNWSQATLARRAGIRAERVSDLESGGVEARLREIVQVADALGLSLQALVFGAVFTDEVLIAAAARHGLSPSEAELALDALERGLASLREERREP
jgi:transcriptional regulator with XRE-family HTH domain